MDEKIFFRSLLYYFIKIKFTYNIDFVLFKFIYNAYATMLHMNKITNRYVFKILVLIYNFIPASFH